MSGNESILSTLVAQTSVFPLPSKSSTVGGITQLFSCLGSHGLAGQSSNKDSLAFLTRILGSHPRLVSCCNYSTAILHATLFGTYFCEHVAGRCAVRVLLLLSLLISSSGPVKDVAAKAAEYMDAAASVTHFSET